MSFVKKNHRNKRKNVEDTEKTFPVEVVGMSRFEKLKAFGTL